MNGLLNNNRHIYTVSGLNRALKLLIEKTYPMLWISGEISNFTRATSGHMYFTLKDDASQISCVMFKGQTVNLKFGLEKGLKIIGFGRVNLYEPRGNYQIVFEHIEPEGTGALHLAFEQLKKKLFAEGLFDEKNKKKIPFLPSRISIITSPTGSVIHDIINVSSRRFPGMHLEIAPVKVQGSDAEQEIINAIQMLNKRESTEVIILARGGGSIEDLMAFNSEAVARAIFNSAVPVISAVGHETDFTIADFTADLRAPTPSAAAEMATPDKNELKQNYYRQKSTLIETCNRYLKERTNRLSLLTDKLVDPRKKLQDYILKNDELTLRLEKTIRKIIISRSESLKWKSEKLLLCSPAFRLKDETKNLLWLKNQLKTKTLAIFGQKRATLNELTQRLNDINPMSVLERGYSIARTKGPNKSVVSRTASVKESQEIEVLIYDGVLDCKVQRIKKNG
jgi:exodeoxyribonuclease VII large subunit